MAKFPEARLGDGRRPRKSGRSPFCDSPEQLAPGRVNFVGKFYDLGGALSHRNWSLIGQCATFHSLTNSLQFWRRQCLPNCPCHSETPRLHFPKGRVRPSPVSCVLMIMRPSPRCWSRCCNRRDIGRKARRTALRRGPGSRVTWAFSTQSSPTIRCRSSTAPSWFGNYETQITRELFLSTAPV